MRKILVIAAAGILIFTGCGEVAPYATGLPTLTLPALPTSTPRPASGPLPELELITPDNISRLELIDRWGKGYARGVAVSPDQQVVAVAAATGVYLYSTSTLEQVGFLDEQVTGGWPSFNPQTLDFSPDGKSLAVAGPEVTFWDVRTFQKTDHFYPLVDGMLTNGIEFSPGGDHVVIFSGASPRACDGPGGNVALYTRQGYLVVDKYFCAPVPGRPHYRFTRNGKFYLFPRHLNDEVFPSEVVVVELSTGQVTTSANKPGQVLYDVSPDGSMFAMRERSEDKEITKIIDAKSQRTLKVLPGDIHFVTSPSGASSWESASRPTETICGLPADSFAVRSQAGSQSLYVGAGWYAADHLLELWDLSSCTRKKYLDFPATNSVVLSPDGANLVVSDQTSYLSLWDTSSGTERFVISNDPDSTQGNVRMVSAFDQSGSRIVVGVQRDRYGSSPEDRSYTLSIWDTRSGEKLRELEPPGKVLSYLITTHDSSIVLAFDDLGVNFWDIEKGTLLGTVPAGSLFALHPNGREIALVTGEEDEPKAIEILDLRSQKVIHHIDTSLVDLSQVHFDQSGSKIAVTFAQDAPGKRQFRVAFFDVAQGSLSHTLESEDLFVWFSPQNHFIAVIRGDRDIELWNYADQTPIRTLPGFRMPVGSHSGIGNISFQLDDQILVSTDDYHEHVRFWNINTGQLIGEIDPAPYTDLPSFYQLTFSPDGRLMLVTTTDGTIRVFGVKK